MKIKIKSILFIVISVYMLTIVIRSVNIHNTWQVEKQSNTLGLYSTNYPIKFLFYKDKNALIKDSDGVYMIDRSKKTNLTKGKEVFYSPIAIGLAALRDLQNANAYRSKDSIALKSFLVNAKWLVNKQDSSGRITFDVPLHTLDKIIKAPWQSALSQGFALSVFSRAYQVTKDSIYIKSIHKSLLQFEKTIEEGGIYNNSKIFGEFLEEYPTEQPTHVLNGFNYTLIGLHDAYIITKNQKAGLLFDKYVKILSEKIKEFDLGGWSAYSLDKPSMKNHFTYCNPWYHKLHIIQLQVLFEKSQLESLNEYAKVFEEDLSGFVPYILYSSYILYSDLVYIYNMFN
ncbi:D-glucuronyl C5-epimerase family protein [Lacinutrix jangbogonensis]|uniref:D-glucuronyl C5-epimerase family protein n=1 Tax=Lacinutrix jangbogonensis TaxID=1469557 RepID=UPI00053DEBC2|nr:D-glucuronyl C5-epimerase family protein [Lacinutrix jangbogonensis]